MKKALSLFLGGLVFGVIPAEDWRAEDWCKDKIVSLLGIGTEEKNANDGGILLCEESFEQANYKLKLDQGILQIATGDASHRLLPAHSSIMLCDDVVHSDIVLDDSCAGLKFFKKLVPKILVLAKDGTLIEYSQNACAAVWEQQIRGMLRISNPASDKWQFSLNGDGLARVVEQKTVQIYDKQCTLLLTKTYDNGPVAVYPHPSPGEWIVKTAGGEEDTVVVKR